MNDIDKLKAELFDLIEVQAGLAARHQQLGQVIAQKHEQLNKAREAAKAEVKSVSDKPDNDQ